MKPAPASPNSQVHLSTEELAAVPFRHRPRSLMLAAFLNLFFFWLGLHKFYLGNKKAAYIRLLLFFPISPFFLIGVMNFELFYLSFLGIILCWDLVMNYPQVERINRSIRALEQQETEALEMADQPLETRILEMADRADGGILTLKDVMREGISLEEAKQVLSKMSQEGICEEVSLNGVKSYCFSS